MSEWKPKRFWKKVDVVSLEKNFCIKLDEKILKTPAKKEMLLPTKALAKKIALASDFKGEIIWDLSKPDGTPKKQLNVNKLKELGWVSKISLDDGILETVKNYKNFNN